MVLRDAVELSVGKLSCLEKFLKSLLWGQELFVVLRSNPLNVLLYQLMRQITCWTYKKGVHISKQLAIILNTPTVILFNIELLWTKIYTFLDIK